MVATWISGPIVTIYDCVRTHSYICMCCWSVVHSELSFFCELPKTWKKLFFHTILILSVTLTAHNNGEGAISHKNFKWLPYVQCTYPLIRGMYLINSKGGWRGDPNQVQEEGVISGTSLCHIQFLLVFSRNMGLFRLVPATLLVKIWVAPLDKLGKGTKRPPAYC